MLMVLRVRREEVAPANLAVMNRSEYFYAISMGMETGDGMYTSRMAIISLKSDLTSLDPV